MYLVLFANDDVEYYDDKGFLRKDIDNAGKTKTPFSHVTKYLTEKEFQEGPDPRKWNTGEAVILKIASVETKETL